MILDKRQRNELYKAIESEHFDPTEFEFTENHTAATLEHPRSSARLTISRYIADGMNPVTDDPYWQVASRVAEGGEQHTYSSIEEVWKQVFQWLRAIKRLLRAIQVDEQTPDLWEELRKTRQISELMEGKENTPFSKEELARITEVVDEVMRHAKESYGLPEDQLRLLEAKLDYLIEAAPHSRRIDWLNTAIGAFASAFAGGVLTPDVVHKVLSTLSAGLGPLFGHPLPMIGA
jgi:hypothetical protein